MREAYGRAVVATVVVVFYSTSFFGLAGVGTTQPGASIGGNGTNMAAFEAEIDLAKSATNRDDKVSHLRRALAARPDDPDNIQIEFRIGNLLMQNYKATTRSASNGDQALKAFESIVYKYDHRKYYSSEPAGTTDSPQMMVPRSEIIVASILMLRRDGTLVAREYLRQAMAELEWTSQTRSRDWEDAPEPKRRPREVESDAEFRDRVSYWEGRKRKGGDGDVMGLQEVAIEKSAVQQLCNSAAGQKGPDPATLMASVIDEFPGTAMAVEAQSQIARIKQSEKKKLLPATAPFGVSP